MIRVAFLVLIFVFMSFEAQACSRFRVDEGKSDPLRLINDLINRTNNIVLAQVTKAEYLESRKQVHYTFEVINLIKGKSHKFFYMESQPLQEFYLNNFHNHKDKIFWENDDFGRLGIPSDCQIRPTFNVSSVYLMLLDKPYHPKSFELIRNYRSDNRSNSKDKWLSYVEAKVSEQK